MVPPLAFSVAGYTELEVLNQFLEELKRAIGEGTTKTQFQENMDRFLEERGYDGLTPYHADRIFRQNMLTAYSVGHLPADDGPGCDGTAEVLAVPDGRGQVREGKPRGHGRPGIPSGFPGVGYLVSAQRIRLPVYGCSRTEEQVRRMGLTVEQTLPDTSNPATGETEAALLPDLKFRTNPAKAEWKPDLAAFPPVLGKLYQEQQKARKANPTVRRGIPAPDKFNASKRVNGALKRKTERRMG